MSIDVAQIRKDFPILATKMRERPLVYLDTAASAQKPRAVIDAISDFYASHYANIHRGVYQLSADATRRYDAVRVKVAKFIGARDPREIVFVRNATEAINLVARSWGDAQIGKGDEIVVTTMEHHANIVPWQMLAARKEARHGEAVPSAGSEGAPRLGPVGVLAVQGSFTLHIDALRRLGIEGRPIRKPEDLEGICGLILPGGESTVMALLMEKYGVFEPLRELGRRGLPIFGTCAGAILLGHGDPPAPARARSGLGSPQRLRDSSRQLHRDLAAQPLREAFPRRLHPCAQVALQRLRLVPTNPRLARGRPGPHRGWELAPRHLSPGADG